MTNSETLTKQNAISQRAFLVFVALLLATFLTHLYFIARYEFRWVDWDTATVTRSIDALQNEGTLSSSHPYAWGFAYQVMIDAISVLTGINPDDLQQMIVPVTFGVLPIIAAIAFFRSVANDRGGWIVAALLVLILPEFILNTSRGTHEKATITLVLTTLLIMSWTLDPRRRTKIKRSLGGGACLLLIMPSLVFYNCFFAVSFIIVTSVSLYACSRMGKIQLPGHLGVFVLYGIVTWAGFVSLYDPASNFFSTANTYWDRLMLILSGSSTSDPYQGVESAWSSNVLWILSNIVAFFLIVSSSTKLLQFLRHGNGHKPNAAFYFHFGATVLMVLYVGLDFVGGSSITNLQLRWLPFWSLFAAPIAFLWLKDTLPHLQRRMSRRMLESFAIVALVIVVPLSLMRATLDPNITNYWIFYDASEDQAIDWTEEFCEGDCWGGLQYRIGTVHVFKNGYQQEEDLRFITANNPWNLSIAIDSATERSHWERVNNDKLDFSTWNCIADVGAASVVARF